MLYFRALIFLLHTYKHIRALPYKLPFFFVHLLSNFCLFFVWSAWYNCTNVDSFGFAFPLALEASPI